MRDAYDTPNLQGHSDFAPARFRSHRRADEPPSTPQPDAGSFDFDDEFGAAAVDDFPLPPSLEPTLMSAPPPRLSRGMKWRLFARAMAAGLMVGGATVIVVLSAADRSKPVASRPAMAQVVASAVVPVTTVRERILAADREGAVPEAPPAAEAASAQPVRQAAAATTARSEPSRVGGPAAADAFAGAAASVVSNASADTGSPGGHHTVRQLDAVDVAGLLRHGHEIAANGDLVGARLLFQRAAEAGDSDAALALAGTYDPIVLEHLRERGLAPDIATARYWYQEAQELGSKEAPRRLDMLASRTNW